MDITTPIGSLGSHNAVGVGSAAIVAPLTVVFQHFQQVDGGTAAAEALLVAVALHAIGTLVAVMLPARKPPVMAPSVWTASVVAAPPAQPEPPHAAPEPTP